MASVSAWVRPIAAKTTLNGSAPAVDCAAICAASSRCGRPATEKIGSFWPRTSVVRASIAEMPVRTGSLGRSRRVGFSGLPATERTTCPEIGGPPSIGSPRPLQTRPSQPSPTGISTGAPEKVTVVDRGTRPSVPSKTCTTARSWSTSRTMP